MATTIKFPSNHPYQVCPKDGGTWKYYDGALGYESLICSKCGIDINELIEGRNKGE